MQEKISLDHLPEGTKISKLDDGRVEYDFTSASGLSQKEKERIKEAKAIRKAELLRFFEQGGSLTNKKLSYFEEEAKLIRKWDNRNSHDPKSKDIDRGARETKRNLQGTLEERAELRHFASQKGKTVRRHEEDSGIEANF
jgi:hypothetical protein